MALFARKAPPAAPQASLEAEVVHWSQKADEAAQALALALAQRRSALSRLIGVTQLRFKAPLNNLLSAYAVARSMAKPVDKASGRSVLNHLGSMHVALPARTSFTHSATVAIASSASGRPDPVGATDTLIPAGGRTVAAQL